MSDTYRVITKKLRVQRGAGRPDLEVARPMNAGRTVFLDSDEAPTLVTFDEHCQVDIPYLLRLGAIVPWAEPAAPADGGEADGKKPR